MEIIENNLAKNTIKVECSKCGSILRCTEDEKNNLPCPVCGASLSEKEKEKIYLICEECGHAFHASEADGVGEYGCYYTYCPICKEKVYLDDGIDITTDNLQLEYFGSRNGKSVDFKEIKSWINIGVKYLKQNPNEHYYYTASGDSFILVTRDEDEFYVMYTNNYRDVYLKK